MNRMTAMAAASVLALVAGPASAAQMSGAIQQIDQTRQTFTIGDTVFTVSPTNTVGPDLTELQEGDEVEVFYSLSETDSEQPYNVMTLSKIEDAGGAGEVSGTVEGIDTNANTFMVGDKAFVVESDSSMRLDQLNEGDEVIVVYDTSDADEPIQVISFSKMN